MSNVTYHERRGQLQTYFDRTAVDAWARLTSDAPLGRIRATVRAGRKEMGRTLVGWLPQDLRGARVLDAGCGPGVLAVEVARRGADVLAVDLSPTLIDLARQRTRGSLVGRIEFVAGDMLSAAFGRFDYIVAMDSLIHYRTDDAIRAISSLASRTNRALLFTFAPKTPALAAMHAVGRLFPRSDRAPAIEPVKEQTLSGRIAAEPALARWKLARSRRVTSGFYKSHALELVVR